MQREYIKTYLRDLIWFAFLNNLNILLTFEFFSIISYLCLNTILNKDTLNVIKRAILMILENDEEGSFQWISEFNIFFKDFVNLDLKFYSKNNLTFTKRWFNVSFLQFIKIIQYFNEHNDNKHIDLLEIVFEIDLEFKKMLCSLPEVHNTIQLFNETLRKKNNNESDISLMLLPISREAILPPKQDTLLNVELQKTKIQSEDEILNSKENISTIINEPFLDLNTNYHEDNNIDNEINEINDILSTNEILQPNEILMSRNISTSKDILPINEQITSKEISSNVITPIIIPIPPPIPPPVLNSSTSSLQHELNNFIQNKKLKKTPKIINEITDRKNNKKNNLIDALNKNISFIPMDYTKEMTQVLKNRKTSFYPETDNSDFEE